MSKTISVELPAIPNEMAQEEIGKQVAFLSSAITPDLLPSVTRARRRLAGREP